MPLKRADLFSGSYVPQLDRLVFIAACRGQEAPSGENDTDVDLTRMPFECADLFPGPHVPQLDRSVPRPGSQSVSARRKRNGSNPIRMVLQSSDQSTGLPVPQLDRAIPGSGGESGAVRRGKGDRTDRIRVPSQRGEGFPSIHVPQLDFIFPRSRRSQRGPIRRKGQRIDLTRMAFQSGNQVWGDLRKHEIRPTRISLGIDDLYANRMGNRIRKTGNKGGWNRAVILEVDDSISLARQPPAGLDFGSPRSNAYVPRDREQDHLVKPFRIANPVANPELDGHSCRACRIGRRRDELSGRPPLPVTLKRAVLIEVGIHRQKLRSAGRQASPSWAVGHDVLTIAEVVQQSEGMAQLVGNHSEVDAARYQRTATLLVAPAGSSRKPAAANPDCINAVVDDDEVNVLLEVEDLVDLLVHNARHIEVVAVRVLPIHAMDQRLTLGIGFNTECPAASSVGLHLLRKESLHLPDPDSHRIDHLLTKRTVVGQEVDHPHGARLAHVQSRQRLGRRAGVIPPPLLVIEGHAEMRAVGWRGRRMAGYRQTEKDAEHRQ